MSQDSIERTKVSIEFTTIVDILSDLMIMVLPLRILWNLRINARQKVGLAMVFGLATISMVFAIVRAVVTLGTLTPHGVSSLERADPISLTLYSVLEATIAVIVSCLPTFRVLFLGTERRPRRHDGEGSSSLSCFGSAGSSCLKSTTPWSKRSWSKQSWSYKQSSAPRAHALPPGGMGEKRGWFSRIKYDNNRTLIITGAQSSARTAESDKTLVASPYFEMKPLDPTSPSLQRPRLIHLTPTGVKNKPLPLPPGPEEMLTIDEETYSDVIRALR